MSPTIVTLDLDTYLKLASDRVQAAADSMADAVDKSGQIANRAKKVVAAHRLEIRVTP